MESDLEKVLAHYGVKGMRWGVRRRSSDSSGPTEVVVKTRPGKKVVAKGGKNLPASDDAVRVATSKAKAKSSSTDSLSTKELQDLVNRMNLEQQYSNLASKEPSKLATGQKAVKSVLSIAKTANDINNTLNSPAGKLLKDQLLKTR